MYASKALVALALAASAAPALGFSYEPLITREDNSLLARNMNAVRSIGEIMGLKRSEVEDILAREVHNSKHARPHGHKQHGAKHGHKAHSSKHHKGAKHHKGSKKHHKGSKAHKGSKTHESSKAHATRELLVRQAQGASSVDDESGAFSIKSALGDVASAAAKILPLFIKREELEMLAREAADDESGAFSIKSALGDVASAAATFLPLFIKREELEMLAREVADDESGAFSVKSALGDAAKLLPLFLKREELARSLNDLD